MGTGLVIPSALLAVIRGGDFRYDAQGVRSAARANPSPDARHLGVGVRLLRIR